MLTKQQIDQLFLFVEKKRVLCYDVQIELVDHIANSIEEKMNADPALSFEEALHLVYKGFGIMGFTHILREKQEMTHKVTRKQFYKLLKQQFGWPKAVLILLLSAFLFFTIRRFGAVSVSGIQVLIAAGAIFLVTYIRTQLVKIRKRTGKRLLLIQNFYTSTLLMMPFYFIDFSVFSEERIVTFSDAYSLFLAVVNAFFVAVGIAYYQTFLSVRQEVMRKYPELFAAS